MSHIQAETAAAIGTSADGSDGVHLADYLLFRHIREGRGGRPAIAYQRRILTYDEVARLVRRAATVLRTNGVRPSDRVVLLLPDSPTFVIGFFGALAAGAIAVPVNPALTPDEVAYITTHMSATLVLVDHRLVGKFAALQNLVSVRVFVTAGDCVDERAEFERAIDAAGPLTDEPVRAPDDIAYCLFSSGTTGAPKGIPHRHADILHCAAAYAMPVLQMTADDVILSVPKMSFGYGLGGNLLFGFLVGATSILFPEPSTAGTICELSERLRPTLLLAQPRLLSDVLTLGVGSSALSSLRLCVSAGEVLVPSLYHRWRSRYDIELIDGFGSTEMGHIFISNRTGEVRPGCAGRVLPGFEVKIVNDDGVPVPPGVTGHLYARGRSATRWYWNDHGRTERTFRDGWVASGDLFRQDADGYLYVAGRADDMIKLGCGEWVSPAEVEDALLQDPAVADGAVVGTTDFDGIIRIKAYVVLVDGARPSRDLEEKLKARVRESWPDLAHKHLSVVEFTTALPRTPTGKLQRFKLAPASLTEFSYDC